MIDHTVFMADSSPYGVEDGLAVFGYRGDGAVLDPEELRVILAESNVGNLVYNGDTVRLEAALGSGFGDIHGVVHDAAIASSPGYRHIRDHCWRVSSLMAGGIELLYTMRETADDPPAEEDDDAEDDEGDDIVVPCAPAGGLPPSGTVPPADEGWLGRLFGG
jgi:hypothetical protein